MARKNKNAHRNPRHDTRKSFRYFCKVLGISPRQRVKLIKYINYTMKEGEQEI